MSGSRGGRGNGRRRTAEEEDENEMQKEETREKEREKEEEEEKARRCLLGSSPCPTFSVETGGWPEGHGRTAGEAGGGDGGRVGESNPMTHNED